MTKSVSVPSYSSIFEPNHPMIDGIFDSEVVVEEKIDGSQFSFLVDKDTGELACRSKGKQIIVDFPEELFKTAVETAKSLKDLLVPGWVYRTEYLLTPKHNTQAYARVPKKHLMLFDVMIGVQRFLNYEDLKKEAARLGLEVPTLFYQGIVEDLDQIKQYLHTESMLGGVEIEGVVVKNYSLFTKEKKIALLKCVDEEFIEKHKIDWNIRNPTTGDLVTQLVNIYRHENRWKKAVQHLRDNGQLTGTLRDIGPLLEEIPKDIKKECEEEIKQKLFDYYWPQISRKVTYGFPEWYKEIVEKELGEEE